MSKTLFFYLFGALMRVFLLTVIALTGIMSFAVLLRPLTENGLDLGQVNRLLLYSMPAMAAYSLPVAGLFAATFVYGRFSADNELMAMRASGVGYLSLRRFSIALPALVLGLIIAVISLLMLCFVVPVFMLKDEQTIYSNIAKVIASRIEQKHEIDFPGSSTNVLNVFAQDAVLGHDDPKHPNVQTVELIGPAIMSYDTVDVGSEKVKVPREFWLARRALLVIRRTRAPHTQQDITTLRVQLDDGIEFPRQFSGGRQAGVGATVYGPQEIASPIAENFKFMNVTRLQQLAADPTQSRKVQAVLQDIIVREQEEDFLREIAAALTKRNSKNGSSFFFATDPDTGDRFEIGGTNVNAVVGRDGLVLTAPPIGNDQRTLWLLQMHGSQQTLGANAKEMHIQAKPDVPDDDSDNPQDRRLSIHMDLYDVSVRTQEAQTEHASFPRSTSIPMPPDIVRIADKTLDDYKSDPLITKVDAFNLRHEQIVVNNGVRSELHGRASFALSCLTLVMVGCALGVMFRSGNFLTAFAVSFLPALLCITLIVCGQQIAVHVPFDPGPSFRDPLDMGLFFIWVGNLAVLVGAIYLTARLQRR